MLRNIDNTIRDAFHARSYSRLMNFYRVLPNGRFN